MTPPVSYSHLMSLFLSLTQSFLDIEMNNASNKAFSDTQLSCQCQCAVMRHSTHSARAYTKRKTIQILNEEKTEAWIDIAWDCWRSKYRFKTTTKQHDYVDLRQFQCQQENRWLMKGTYDENAKSEDRTTRRVGKRILLIWNNKTHDSSFLKSDYF